MTTMPAAAPTATPLSTTDLNLERTPMLTEGSPQSGHLVVSRRSGQRIVIGQGPDAIIVTITDVRGDKVRVGIRAPRDVKIRREELYRSIEDGKKGNLP